MNKVGRVGSLEERFLKKVSKTEGCWFWTASTNRKNGYGQIKTAPKLNEPAHRVSYKLYVAEIPEGKEVMHTCDNTLCVNPGHLKLGTHTENMHDMFNKQRRRNKLTPEQRKAIVEETGTCFEIADKYGISFSMAAKYKRKEYYAC